MLSSFNSLEEEDDHADYLRRRRRRRHGFISHSSHIRDLMITCADLIDGGDLPAARHAVSLLSAATSPCGDAVDRVAHLFSGALSLRLARQTLPPADPIALHSAHLLLNQVTPFLRFCHLTANQAILEAVEGRRLVHILDFDTGHGVQWPPLLQAVSERAGPTGRPAIRITGTGSDLALLRRTGERLKHFAHSLGLRFQFFPLLLPSERIMTESSNFFNLAGFRTLPGETLAVNCPLFLHKLLAGAEVEPFLRAVKAMAPAVLTVAEREASHNAPGFMHRFAAAADHYGAVFESLEATLPASSEERLTLEQVLFGREIADVVAMEGGERRERHERFELWERALWGAGFSSLALSPFSLSQAKLLLRIHYPLEGYQLQMVKDALFLGWRGQPLFSVSSWRS
ncbi:GRAS family transcription factor [Wolffia australiana]